MLEEKIEKLGEYYDGMFPLSEKGWNGVRVKLPNNWVLKEKDEDNILIVPKKEGEKTVFCGNPTTKLVDIFDFIIEIIDFNMESQNKVLLYKQKVEELKELFNNNSLAKLETLIFTFEKGKKNNTNKEKTNEI